MSASPIGNDPLASAWLWSTSQFVKTEPSDVGPSVWSDWMFGSPQPLSGAITGDGTLTGDAVLVNSLSGAITGDGTLAGELEFVPLELAGDLTGDGTLTGALDFVPLELAAALTGDGTLAGNAVFAGSQPLSGAITGVGTLADGSSSPSFPRIITVRSRPGVRPRRAVGSAFGGGRERSRVR